MAADKNPFRVTERKRRGIFRPKEKVSPTAPKGNMKAVRIHEYGGIDKLVFEDAPIPEIGPDEVLLKVNASSVNPVDWKVCEGRMKDAMPIPFPFIPGCDVAGVVVHTGILATQFNPGQAVIARTDALRSGCYAEYVAVKAADLAYAPVTIPPGQSAGIPLAAQAAWMGLFEVGRLRKDQKILVQGASGGVGSFAVQFAKIAGAHVAGTTSTANVNWVKSLGIDEVIDYKKEEITRLKDFDMVFDTVGGDTQEQSFKVLRKGGTLVSTVGVNYGEAEKHGVNGKSFMANSNGARLQQITGLIDKRVLQVIIDKKFSLEEIKAAHELSKSGRAKGKIILLVSENTHVET